MYLIIYKRTNSSIFLLEFNVTTASAIYTFPSKYFIRFLYIICDISCQER